MHFKSAVKTLNQMQNLSEQLGLAESTFVILREFL